MSTMTKRNSLSLNAEIYDRKSTKKVSISLLRIRSFGNIAIPMT
jgi:hypothetical protein